jgi:hypothetical protein
MFTSYAELIHAVGAELPSVNKGDTIVNPGSASGIEK